MIEMYIMEVDEILKDVIPSGIQPLCLKIEKPESVLNTHVSNDGYMLYMLGECKLDATKKYYHLVGRKLSMVLKSSIFEKMFNSELIFVEGTVEGFNISHGYEIFEMQVYGSVRTDDSIKDAYDVLEKSHVSPYMLQELGKLMQTIKTSL